jgi:hypothetical protein
MGHLDDGFQKGSETKVEMELNTQEQKDAKEVIDKLFGKFEELFNTWLNFNNIYSKSEYR